MPAMANPCCETNQHQTGQHQPRDNHLSASAASQTWKGAANCSLEGADNRASVVVTAPALADLQSRW